MFGIYSLSLETKYLVVVFSLSECYEHFFVNINFK